MEQNIAKIDREKFDNLLGNRIGLIIGAEFTKSCGIWNAVSQALGVDTKRSFWDILPGGDLRTKSQLELREQIRKVFDHSRAEDTAVRKLAALRWSAILSCTYDLDFDLRLQQAAAKRGAGPTATIISQLDKSCPPQTVPIFKLIGSFEREDWVSDLVTYAVARAQWPPVLRQFTERLRDRPALCLGMGGADTILVDLMAAMLHHPAATPSWLIFLEHEMAKIPKEALQLAQGRIRLVALSASLADTIGSITAAEKSAYTAPLRFSKTAEPSWSDLASFSDGVAIVNTQLASSVQTEEKNRLLDLLFSPSVARWEPYVHKLDFERDITTEISEWLLAQDANSKSKLRAAVLTGVAASGKTTILKRVALSLAARDYPVFWLKPWFFPDGGKLLHEFFRTVAKLPQCQATRIFLFVDDPLGLGGFTTYDFGHAAKQAGVNPFLIAAYRTSDWQIYNKDALIGDFHVLHNFSVEETFSCLESQRFPDYLVRLGIANNVSDAQTRIRTADVSNARDVLSTLYWLLPHARKHIEGSVKGEYFRLGERAAFTQVILGNLSKTSQLLKEAYEMVAVANRFGTSLPIEVLVSALGISFTEWLEGAKGVKANWGLLYEEPTTIDEPLAYRTRNSLVTDIIVTALNGGRISRTGELRVMSQLLSACNGSTPVYREFAVRSLVPWGKNQDFEYAEGLALYDTALSALPLTDKTLLHHKGLWVKNIGRDPQTAKTILSDALRAEDYPYASRGEINEHIYTSLAASTLDAMESGLQAVDSAKTEVLNYLLRASSEHFLNLNAVHVKANLILRLVDHLGDDDASDRLNLVNNGLAEVDRVMLLISTPFGNQDREQLSKDIQILQESRGTLLSRVLDIERLKVLSEELWARHARQDGFTACVRKMFQVASEKNKGSLFNDAFKYFQACSEKVEASGAIASTDLLQAGVDVYYQWRLNRITGDRNLVDWLFLREMTSKILKSAAFSKLTLYRFINAIAAAHLNDWQGALRIFAELRNSGVSRDQLWRPRVILQNAEGDKWKVQGTIKDDGGRKYFHVPILHQDFYTSRDEHWPKNEEFAHAYVMFSFGGPTAWQELGR